MQESTKELFKKSQKLRERSNALTEEATESMRKADKLIADSQELTRRSIRLQQRAK